MDKSRSWLFGILIAVLALILISLMTSLSASLSFSSSLRIVFGSAYALFLPGFVLSFVFFPKIQRHDDKNKEREKGAVDWIERIALSFALSIAIVPLAVFYLNLLGVKINFLNSFLTIFGIIVISSVILFYRMKK